jgi:hypothetical protein
MSPIHCVLSCYVLVMMDLEQSSSGFITYRTKAGRHCYWQCRVADVPTPYPSHTHNGRIGQSFIVERWILFLPFYFPNSSHVNRFRGARRAFGTTDKSSQFVHTALSIDRTRGLVLCTAQLLTDISHPLKESQSRYFIMRPSADGTLYSHITPYSLVQEWCLLGCYAVWLL